jgi:hypothetical protein
LPTEDPADGRRYITRRQARGRDLVEQRLEQVIVVTIDDRDGEPRSRQLLGRRKPAETCPDNHDMEGTAMAEGHVGACLSLC